MFFGEDDRRVRLSNPDLRLGKTVPATGLRRGYCIIIVLKSSS